MADNRSKRGGGDRTRVASGQGYEVGYFARKHGISRDQAREIIKRIGNNREKLNAEASKARHTGGLGQGGRAAGGGRGGRRRGIA